LGGHILSDDGKSVVMDEGAVQALELLKKVTSSGITDPSLTNWSFAYSPTNPCTPRLSPVTTRTIVSPAR
ncbi:hypothetical protein ABT266_36830, partial [Amycolatopsis sp. NPDC000746]